MHSMQLAGISGFITPMPLKTGLPAQNMGTFTCLQGRLCGKVYATLLTSGRFESFAEIREMARVRAI